MGFVKTSVSVTPPEVMPSPPSPPSPPEVGEVRDGLMWDGDKWVPVPEDQPQPHDDGGGPDDDAR